MVAGGDDHGNQCRHGRRALRIIAISCGVREKPTVSRHPHPRHPGGRHQANGLSHSLGDGGRRLPRSRVEPRSRGSCRVRPEPRPPSPASNGIDSRIQPGPGSRPAPPCSPSGTGSAVCWSPAVSRPYRSCPPCRASLPSHALTVGEAPPPATRSKFVRHTGRWRDRVYICKLPRWARR